MSIYLDHAATTPVDPAVRDAMLPFLGEAFGNPSSVHRRGQAVRRAIDRARDLVAGTLSADSSEIYFTSGGTEANNTALLGVLLDARERGRDHLVVAAAEHHSVLDAALFAKKALGFGLTVVAVDRYGLVTPEAVADAITERTALVSVMHANNEVGSINPVGAIADVVHARGAVFHTDAVQTLGAMPISAPELGADLLTISAHKIYGPKGVGALYVRRGVRFTPWVHGGNQERERRAGTENVAGIVGLGRAVELLPEWRDHEAVRQMGLRDGFIEDLLARIPAATLNGHPTRRLPANVNVALPGIDGETLLLALDLRNIAASSGSACASGSIEPSHVLLALGQSVADARRAVRLTLGRSSTKEQLDSVVETLAALASNA